MEQNEFSFNVVFKTSYSKEKIEGLLNAWLIESVNEIIDQHCEIDGVRVMSNEN